MRLQILLSAAALLVASTSVTFAQYPSSGGGNRTGSDDVWVRVVKNSTGGRTETRHNSNTQEQIVITFDRFNRPVLKRSYRLNRYGQPTDFLIYDKRDVALYRGKFTYDGNDRLHTEELYALPGGQLVRRLTYDPFNPKRQPQTQMFGAGVSQEVLRQMSDEDVPSVRPGGSSQQQPKKKKRGGLINRFLGRDR
ncbi:MAG: hypothetical protein AAF585_14345 [Verrucomicrobiota bacterium]